MDVAIFRSKKSWYVDESGEIDARSSEEEIWSQPEKVGGEKERIRHRATNAGIKGRGKMNEILTGKTGPHSGNYGKSILILTTFPSREKAQIYTFSQGKVLHLNLGFKLNVL